MSTHAIQEEPARSRRGIIAIAIVALVFTAALVALVVFALPMLRSGAGADQARFADYGPVPDVQLTERSGTAMRLGALKGHVWVANFIFTRCGGSCPGMSTKMAALQDSLAGRGDVMLVSFTVDPENDTPQRLAAYASGYHADGRRWLFLTGTNAQMQALARNDFHLGLQEGTDPKEPIIHSKRFVLVDRNGHIRGYYSGEDPDAQRALLDDVAALTEEGA